MTKDFYFDKKNGVVTLRCRALDMAGFEKHCFTTRLGGVSTGDLYSLNLSFSREDGKTVEQNYRRVFDAVGFSGACALTDQRHTDNLAVIEGGDGFIKSDGPTDGLVTAKSGICLAVFVADCAPVLLADPVKQVVSAVHSGWRGTAAGISAGAVGIMKERFGSDPESIIAAIGPCIGACCYEVGDDVYEGFGGGSFFEKKENGRYMLDLSGAIRRTLERAGLAPGNIYESRECTRCGNDLYYSHRATGDRRGNMAGMIEI